MVASEEQPLELGGMSQEIAFLHDEPESIMWLFTLCVSNQEAIENDL